MLDFKPFTPQTMVQIKPLLEAQQFRSCDYTVGGLFMWRDFFNEEYAIYDNMLICRVNYLDKGMCYTFPIGDGNLELAVTAIKSDSKERGLPLRFCCITEGGEAQLSTILGEPIESIAYRDWADYLYTHESFCTYRGKRLVTQRNHCNRFIREFPQYAYLPITSYNIDEVRQFMVSNAPVFSKESILAKEEYHRAQEVLDYFSLFGFMGGMIKVDGKVIGVSIGEIVADTLYVHIEKALIEYSGVYPMLASLFAKQTQTEGLRYINREDDSGDVGLRRSKTEYRPT